jgi:hypothetical protein
MKALSALLVMLSLGSIAEAACSRDCVTQINNEFNACEALCQQQALTEGNACAAALNPTPPTCGLDATTTTSSTTSTTSAPSSTTTTLPQSATCTEVLGFSQTGQWYLNSLFESIVGNNGWQLRAYASAGVQWQDPTFAGWMTAPISPCLQNAANPDRILLTISTPSGIPTLDWWVQNIRAEIATIRQQRPNAGSIILQSVVGGPGGATCYFGGNLANPVHASVIHPTIDQAIAVVVLDSPDLVAGISPEVASCGQYADNTGHLTTMGRSVVGQAIGAYYAMQ